MRKALVSLLVVFSLIITVSAHSGRTDSSGGHKDNKNASGLGSYHYHCGGYPAHLHTRGYCPYKDTFPTSVKVSAEKTTLTVGEKTTITGSVSPSDACSTKVSWESSDSKVISIKNGVAIAVGAGTATITATTFNGKEDQITIKVSEAPTDPSTEASSTPSSDSKNDSAGLSQSTPTGSNIEAEESEGSPLLGFLVIAGIVGIVIFFKRRR